MFIITFAVIGIVAILAIVAIVISVRSAISTSLLDTRISALETTINALSASQKTQLVKMTKIVTDLQRNFHHSTRSNHNTEDDE
jgi:type II secretory pathway pseudopilin PulG